jgi:hypothetical protein
VIESWYSADREELETMPTINIDELSEAELIDLNHRVVERLRFLSQMRAHSQMLDYKIGERVTFHPDGHPPLFGIVTRYNRNTVTGSPIPGSTGTLHHGYCAEPTRASRQTRITPRLFG